MKALNVLIKGIPLLLIVGMSTGCSMVNQMNDLVNTSTYSIEANADAVERNTAQVRYNAYLVNQSTQAIIENHRLIETLNAE